MQLTIFCRVSLYIQCCGSGMFIPDPGSWFLPIPDPGSRIQKQQQKRGVKKNYCHTFLCSHKFHKIENYFSFEVLKKKILANFQRIIELFTQKIVTKLWKYGFGIRDPRSGIRDQEKTNFGSRIPDPGVKKAPDPGSATLYMYIKNSLFISRMEQADSRKVRVK
jgi:hypothetical protein